MTITPEELARLPEFDGKRVALDMPYEGLIWLWRTDAGNVTEPLSDQEKSMLEVILSDRRNMKES